MAYPRGFAATRVKLEYSVVGKSPRRGASRSWLGGKHRLSATPSVESFWNPLPVPDVFPFD